MKLRTLIIDDEPIALEKLKNYVEKESFLELAGVCSSGLDAAAILNTNAIDVIFTDIQMPDLNGLDMVTSLENPPLVVFITAYADYAVESYRLSAVDYLLKPYGFTEFHRAATKALNVYRQKSSCMPAGSECTSQGPLFVKTDYRYVKIDLPDITYIKGYGEYLQIFIIDDKSPLLTLSSFNAVKKSLSKDFIQVHRSYVVNMEHVAQITKGHIIMSDNTEIPIGDSYKDAINDYLASRAIGNTKRK